MSEPKIIGLPPRALIPSNARSCQNCLHQFMDYGTERCHRLQDTCRVAVRYGECTVALKYWHPRPAADEPKPPPARSTWWAGFFRWLKENY